MPVMLCQHCGADLSHHPLLYPESPSVSSCFDCGLDPGDTGAWQLRFPPGEKFLHLLGDWTPTRRVALSVARRSRGMPTRASSAGDGAGAPEGVRASRDFLPSGTLRVGSTPRRRRTPA